MSEPFDLTDYERTEQGESDFRKWHRTYSAARTLFTYLFERWRSDPYVYHLQAPPRLGDKFEIILENA